MKLLLLIVVFYASHVESDQVNIAKIFPKKYKPDGPGKILINSGKYIANPRTFIKTKTLQPNAEVKNSKYTVFQLVGKTKTIQGVPDSPYFAIDPTGWSIESRKPKPRVKKVLPDFIWRSPVRHKRSVGAPEVKTDNKTNTQLNKNKQRNDEKDGKKLKGQVNTKSKAEKSKLVKKVQPNPKKQSQNKNTSKSSKPSHVNKKQIKQKGNKEGKKSQKLIRAKKTASGQSKKLKATRSKTGSKGRVIGKNGTSMKKLKAGGKRQGKFNSKQKMRQRRFQKISKGHLTKNKTVPETRRLTSGKQAVIEDYPYTVSIQKDGQHWCSGALLNPRLVITTANCLWKSRRISRMQVRAGSSFTDRGGQLVGIQEVMKHPKWGIRKSPNNDVALVLLDTKIRFSDTVHGVDLPNRIMLPAFDDAWVTSWGADARDGVFNRYENTLQVYHTRVMNPELCNNITSRFGVKVTENFICLSQSGQTSPCTRDTGAPAVSDGVLWGLASWGIRKLCGTERFPSMFSYLASRSIMDFIVNGTSYLMSDERRYPFLDRPRYRYNGQRTQITTEAAKLGPDIPM